MSPVAGERRRRASSGNKGGRTLSQAKAESLRPGPYGLVALDIDYTLINADQRIAPHDLDAIRRCMERGVEVVLATGRTKPTTIPVAEQIGPDIPMICNTGGIIYDADGHIVRRLTLPLDLSRSLLTQMKADDIPVRVDADGQFFFSHTPLRSFPGLEAVVTPDIAERLATPPDQIIVFGREPTEWVIKHFSYLEGEVQLLVLPSHDEPRVVHILHPLATKGAALAEYCRRRGIERRATIAFGDSLNDFSLLSFAGMGVAVADSEPRLHLVADKVMTHEETLADVLETYVLND